MSDQDQIKKLSEMIGNCILVGDSNEQIAEMALTMALHWNQDTKEAAPEMYGMLDIITEDAKEYESRSGNPVSWVKEAEKALSKARGEK